MSVFLTPALVPFYGGTYFPPQSRYGMPAFKDVLITLASMWQEDRTQLYEASKKILAGLSGQAQKTAKTGMFTEAIVARATAWLIRTYDWTHGGWGSAPKFPQPMALDFLLRRSSLGDEGTLKVVVHALKAMAQGEYMM